MCRKQNATLSWGRAAPPSPMFRFYASTVQRTRTAVRVDHVLKYSGGLNVTFVSSYGLLTYSNLAPSWICFHIGPFAAAPSTPAAARLATLRAASFISKATSKVFSSNDACFGKGVWG